MSARGLRSGELAAAAGVNVETLRYYERRGLLTTPDRSLGGHRHYPPEAITVLRVIKAAQRLGFSLAEIIDLLDTGPHRHGWAADPGLDTRARDKLQEVEGRIADLHVIANKLREVIDAGCDDLFACAEGASCPIPFDSMTGGDRGAASRLGLDE